MTFCSPACVFATRILPGIASSPPIPISRIWPLGRRLRIRSLSFVQAVHCKQRVDLSLVYQFAPSAASARHRQSLDVIVQSSASNIELGNNLVNKAHSLQNKNECVANLNLRSSIHLSVIISIGSCIAFATAVAYWAFIQDGSSQDTLNNDPFPLEYVATEIAPGHHGNLTPEQEDKLRKLWHAIFRICGIHNGSVAAAEKFSADEKPAAELEVPKKKRGFSLFKSASQPDASAPSDTRVADSDEDKYGLTKQYQEILASQKPEDIRDTIWAMMKHDHPDDLVLRFLRARKWNIDQALVMLVSAMNWRRSMKVDQDIMKNGEAGAEADEKSGGDGPKKELGRDFLKQSRMGKSFLHGTDKEGRPICVVKVRLHKASEQSPESLERYTVFLIETARLALKPPVDTAASFISHFS